MRLRIIRDTSPEEPEGPATIQERFERFHEANPWVYEELVLLARELVEVGHRKLGINMLWEVVRWKVYRATSDPSSSFKLNDHYPSRYARLISEQEPDLRGFFELRKLRAS